MNYVNKPIIKAWRKMHDILHVRSLYPTNGKNYDSYYLYFIYIDHNNNLIEDIMNNINEASTI